MQLELWSIDKVKPYENNPRRNESAVDAAARSIEECGFRQPIVVDEGGTTRRRTSRPGRSHSAQGSF